MIINYGYQKELDRRLTLLDLLCVVSLVMSPHSKTQRLKDRKEDSRERELSYPIIPIIPIITLYNISFQSFSGLRPCSSVGDASSIVFPFFSSDDDGGG